ncbi:MAG: porin family protein [Chitinophagales bacterium]
MKNFTIITLFVMVCSTLTAQHMHMNPGIKAGLNLASLNSENDDFDYSFNTSLNAGVFVHMHFNKLIAIQPELNFSGQGAQYDFAGTNLHLNLAYVNLPVILQIMLGNGFRLQTGPQVGVLVSANSKEGDTSTDVKSSFNKPDLSWMFGASYVHKSGFGLDARYNLGLSNINEDDSEKIKNSVIAISLFYQLKGKHD